MDDEKRMIVAAVDHAIDIGCDIPQEDLKEYRRIFANEIKAHTGKAGDKDE